MPWNTFVVPADWGAIFAIDTPILEVFVRITVVYFFLVILLRVTLKREAGGTSLRDLLVLVLIADAVQNGMAGDYKSVGDALVIVGTVGFWAYILDWAGYRSPPAARPAEPGTARAHPRGTRTGAQSRAGIHHAGGAAGPAAAAGGRAPRGRPRSLGVVLAQYSSAFAPSSGISDSARPSPG